MSKEMVIRLRRVAEDDYVGSRWVVQSIREKGIINWFRSLFSKKGIRKDYSTESNAPSIGVSITWDQYNILTDRVGLEWNGDLRPMFFVPPPQKPSEAIARI
jgi:hypothetical protein